MADPENYRAAANDRERQQSCALAALVQSVVLVHQCANAQANQSGFAQNLMRGLMITDPENAGEIYGSTEDLLLGINSAESMLIKPDPSLLQPLKYLIELVALEKSLRGKPKLVAILSERIQSVQSSFSALTEQQQYQCCADIYQATIGKLDNKIHVLGKQEQLEQRLVAEKVRALLLCGVRFAWLWRQLGGRRWHLLVQRKRLRKNMAYLHKQSTVH